MTKISHETFYHRNLGRFDFKTKENSWWFLSFSITMHIHLKVNTLYLWVQFGAYSLLCSFLVFHMSSCPGCLCKYTTAKTGNISVLSVGLKSYLQLFSPPPISHKTSCFLPYVARKLHYLLSFYKISDFIYVFSLLCHRFWVRFILVAENSVFSEYFLPKPQQQLAAKKLEGWIGFHVAWI